MFVLGESTIGRDESCDLSIDSIALSRTHAVLLVENGFHFIMDTGSVNKTFRDVVRCAVWMVCKLTLLLEPWCEL